METQTRNLNRAPSGETLKWLEFVSALCAAPAPTSIRDLTILFISARSDTGGGPRHLFDLLQSLEGSGVRTLVAAPDGEPFGPKFLCHSDLYVPIQPRSFSLISFFRMLWLVYSENVSVIHSHGRGAGVYSRVLGLLTRRPVLHTFHGIHSAPGFMGRVKLRLDQFLAFFPFHALFVSDSERERARQLKTVRRQRCELVPNAVDLRRFDTPEEANRRALKVGIFLRADQAKGPDLWLRHLALTLADPAFSNISFSCAGIPRANLSTFGLIPDRLSVEGELDEPASWMKGLDVYVSTSRSEGMPLGVLEAMAAGKPCLLSRIEGHREFFRENVALGFPLENSKDFIAQLKLLLEHVEKRQTLALAGRHLIESQHSLPVFRERLLAIYTDLTRSLNQSSATS